IIRRTLDGETDPADGLRSRQGEQLRRLLADLPANGGWSTLERRDSVDLTRALYERIAALGEGAAPPLPPGRSRIRLDRIRRDPPLATPTQPLRTPEPERPKAPPTEAPRPGPTLVVEGKGQPPPLTNDEKRVDNAGGRQVAVSYADT